jgi:hypothetical protein
MMKACARDRANRQGSGSRAQPAPPNAGDVLLPSPDDDDDDVLELPLPLVLLLLLDDPSVLLADVVGDVEPDDAVVEIVAELVELALLESVLDVLLLEADTMPMSRRMANSTAGRRIMPCFGTSCIFEFSICSAMSCIGCLHASDARV